MFRIFKYIFFFVFCTLVIKGASAQNYNLNKQCDSIKIAIKIQSKPEQFISLLDLVDKYRFISADSVDKYGKMAFTLANELKDNHKCAEALIVLGVNAYKRDDSGISLMYLNKGAVLANKTDDLILKGKIYLKIAQSQMNMESFEDALQNFTRAYTLFDNAGSYEYKAFLLDVLGYMYIDFENMNEAMSFFLVAKKLLIYERKDYLLALENQHCGYVFLVLNKFDEAMIYLDNSKRIALKKRDFNRLLAIDREYARLTFSKGQIQTGIQCLTDNVENAHKLGNRVEQANSMNLLAFFLQKSGYLYSALNAQKKVLQLRKKIKFEKGICNTVINLGDAFFRVSAYDSAEYYLMKGSQLARQLKYTTEINRANYKLYLLYEKMGDADKALFFFEIYQKLRKEFVDKQAVNHSVFIRNNYALQNNLEIINKLSASNKFYRISAILVFIILITIIISAVIYVLYKRYSNTGNFIELKYKLLLSQLNPLFIYLSLKSIESNIISGRTEESGRYLAEFAKLFRIILLNPVNSFHSIEKEIEAMNYYFRLQKLRYGSKFDYEIDVSPDFNISLTAFPPFLGHLLSEALFATVESVKIERFFLYSKFYIINNTVFQTFDTNIPFINQSLFDSTLKRNNNVLQIMKERISQVQIRLKIKIELKMHQYITDCPETTRTWCCFEVPLRSMHEVGQINEESSDVFL